MEVLWFSRWVGVRLVVGLITVLMAAAGCSREGDVPVATSAPASQQYSCTEEAIAALDDVKQAVRGAGIPVSGWSEVPGCFDDSVPSSYSVEFTPGIPSEQVAKHLKDTGCAEQGDRMVCSTLGAPAGHKVNLGPGGGPGIWDLWLE